MKIMMTGCAVLLSTAIPALANWDHCDDLWVSRNAIFDQAGHCFGSALGKAVFDNSDCVSKSPALSQSQQKRLAEIRAQEEASSCKVDTSRSTLDIPFLEVRKTLLRQPLPDFESSCQNYLGEDVAVHSGASRDTPIIGYIKKGDDVFWAHDGTEGWVYASEIKRNGNPVPVIGWHSETVFGKCEFSAG